MHPPAISELGPAAGLWGRQAQVEVFRSRLRALQFGCGGTVLVSGLRGMGKTALLLRAVALGQADPRPLVRAAMLEDAGRLLPDARSAEAVPLLETPPGDRTRDLARRLTRASASV